LPAEVAVCCWVSLLVHTTEPPTGTVIVVGSNLKSAIPMARQQTRHWWVQPRWWPRRRPPSS
jgi:hypothetical protein